MNWFKHIGFNFLIIALAMNLHGQNGFSKTYSLNNNSTVTTDAHYLNGFIYANGLITDTTITNEDVNVLLKLDMDGNLVDTIFKRVGGNYIYSFKRMIDLPPNGFITIGNHQNDVTARLNVYHTDTLWNYFLFTDTPSIAFALKDITKHSDGCYYALCLQSDPDFDPNIVVLKLDSNFNKIWRRKYGTVSYGELASCIIELNDGNILIGTNKSNIGHLSGFENQIFPTYFIKIDTSGTILQQWTNPDVNSFTPGQVAQLSSGDYVYCGRYVGYHDGVGYAYVKNYVCRRTQSFGLVWEKFLSNMSSTIISLEDVTIHDNKMFAVGTEADTILWNNYGVLYCLGLNGNILYKRYYDVPAPLNAIIWNEYKFLYSIEIPNDSTILMSGQIVGSTPPDNPSQYGWVIKSNIYGCLVDTGSFHYASLEPSELSDLNVLIYPNPAFNEIQMNVSDELIGSKFCISNISGQRIQMGTIESEITFFDISNFEPGVYIISLIDDNTSKQIRFIKN